MTFSLSNEYYIVMALALLVVLMKGGVRRVKGLYVAFTIVCLLSILFNDIPAIFRPWGRFATFVTVIALVSPMLQSPSFRRFRVEAFVLIQYLLLLVTIISFFATMAGYNSISLTVGRTGITTQVMIMGPIAGISLIFCVYQIWIQRTRKLLKVEKYIYIFGVFCSFAMNLMAVSRAAIAAATVGVIALIVYKARFRTGKALTYIITICMLLIISYPLWNKYSSQVEEKNRQYVEGSGMFTSRQSLWNDRLGEFKESPLIGIGFAAVDLGEDSNNQPSSKMNYATGTGNVEPGSGWLLVLSMTGISGFVLFVLMFYQAFKKTILMVKRQFVEPYCLLGAVLAFFTIHMLAEGYSLAGGSFLFFNLWLLLGTIDAWPDNKKNLVL